MFAAIGTITTKIDMYAYGVILMEIITGRRVIDEFLPEDDIYIVSIFRKNVLNHEKIWKVIDPTLELNSNDLLEHTYWK